MLEFEFDTGIERGIYLGFVLDAINRYLVLGAKVYMMGGGSQVEAFRQGAIEIDGQQVISAAVTDRAGVFRVRGFPEDKVKDFLVKGSSSLKKILDSAGVKYKN
jgi:hypothetical protein